MWGGQVSRPAANRRTNPFASVDDVVDRHLVDPVLDGEHRSSLTCGHASSDRIDLSPRQFGLPVPLTAVRRSVNQAISQVLRLRPPSNVSPVVAARRVADAGQVDRHRPGRPRPVLALARQFVHTTLHAVDRHVAVTGLIPIERPYDAVVGFEDNSGLEVIESSHGFSPPVETEIHTS
jgi:hypothetical protein